MECGGWGRENRPTFLILPLSTWKHRPSNPEMLCAIRNTYKGLELYRFLFHKCDHRGQTHIYRILPQNFSADDRITTRTWSAVHRMCMHITIYPVSSPSRWTEQQWCGFSLVRHFWCCCKANTCTVQRSPGCRTGCVCDKHTVNRTGEQAGSSATTPQRTPSC